MIFRPHGSDNNPRHYSGNRWAGRIPGSIECVSQDIHLNPLSVWGMVALWHPPQGLLVAEWSVSEFALVTDKLHPNRRNSPDSRRIVGPHQCTDRFDIDTKTTDKGDRDRRRHQCCPRSAEYDHTAECSAELRGYVRTQTRGLWRFLGDVTSWNLLDRIVSVCHMAGNLLSRDRNGTESYSLSISCRQDQWIHC